MLGQSCHIWQRRHQTASGTLGAIMLGFGLALFLLLTHSGSAQAHEFGAPPDFSSAKVVQSVADGKADRPASAAVLSASTLGESGCHDGHCGLCMGGHCFGCSAVALAASPDIASAAEAGAPAFPDQSGFALTRPDEAFRPPRSVL
ncbi:MAG: hypothetical protein EOQ50_30405 [Mesorhizobium sp.]|uniref:hypothetical protein n=1 Tax=Mesorhizobium sp. TaxID=1871066 RepID=UPI000FE99B79|nr:hypothetical protein [Mesorhizobium sp.]RWB67688.1 MAG: hypothetical protein EOQ50_30405 [Mesorhizobium sp.]RWL79419.1 MAG: hypothetical protein EOR69_25550 [Mesorhizobium sp.]RWL83161.1 MAG: hypothetical protein EOR67_25890 [Mesorhizobium sp.]RWL93985.1 MAG: hypothetical protein EOR70_26795 [Mesorhizobium sp.]TIP00523.1 MAG: hypothetical protein E5X72_29590 [Mesorhizobium sp.]